MKEYFQFSNTSPTYAMIWMHGLGASSQDMQSLAALIQVPEITMRHVFLEAPKRPVSINQGMVMPAWYNIYGMDLTAREDLEGLAASRLLVEQAITTLLEAGFDAHQIILAGFSQGGALALYTALHYQKALAGVVVLSGYLPGMEQLTPCLPKDTAFFIGYGRYDPIVMPAWTQLTIEYLKDRGYQHLFVANYPTEHHVCTEELQDLSAWINRSIGSKHASH